MNTYF